MAEDRRGAGKDRSERYRRGLPGHHDPTAGIGGAAPAQSALTLRFWLAVFGLTTCTAFAIWLYAIGAPIVVVALLGVLAVIAVIDLIVIVRRKRRGEPG
jgi:Flp pilus assembly protein TadB